MLESEFLIITINNVEELIFLDKNVQKVLPGLAPLFRQWSLSRQMPQLQALRQSAVIGLLSSLAREHLELLSEYFGEEVSARKLKGTSHSGVTNLSDAGQWLNDLEGFAENFSVAREADSLYISLWS